MVGHIYKSTTAKNHIVPYITVLHVGGCSYSGFTKSAEFNIMHSGKLFFCVLWSVFMRNSNNVD